MSILSLHICGGLAELADALPCDATSGETSAVQDTTLAGAINSIHVKSVGPYALLQFAEGERHKPLADGSANEYGWPTSCSEGRRLTCGREREGKPFSLPRGIEGYYPNP